MSLPSRSRRRCAGRGQCAPGLRARGLKIPCAPSPEACGRRSVGDRVCERLCHTILPEFGEKEPAASSPLPSATISDTPQRLVLGYPVTSKEDARSSGPSSGDHLSLTC